MQTRERFQTALARVASYRADHFSRRPALTFRVAELEARSGRAATKPVGRAFPPKEVDGLVHAVEALRGGAVSAVEMVQDAYRAVETWERHVHAYEYLVSKDEALRSAAAADALLPAERGPLHGVPLSIKDIINVAGMPTTASSRTLQGYVPDEDAETVARLRRAGGLLLGKTTTHEYAMGVTTPQSRNPWDLTRDPGGSSGGAAITLATGMALGALGTDTRASIRVPAALCGTVGFKPTFGLISTHGIIMMSWSIDTVAPMARSVGDVALLLNVLAGPDPKDLSSVQRAPLDYGQFVGMDIRGLRIGVPAAALGGVEPEVLTVFKSAMSTLAAQGAEIVEITEPTVDDFDLANAAGLLVSRCEALPFHNSLLGRDGERDYNPDVRDQVLEATQVRAVDYLEAQRYRGELTERMGRLLGTLDALAMPTSRVAAPRSEEGDDYLLVLSQNCIPWSFIGFPAVSVPGGLTSSTGLPVGVELVGAPFDEGALLAIASALESAHDLHLTPPLPQL